MLTFREGKVSVLEYDLDSNSLIARYLSIPTPAYHGIYSVLFCSEGCSRELSLLSVGTSCREGYAPGTLSPHQVTDLPCRSLVCRSSSVGTLSSLNTSQLLPAGLQVCRSVPSVGSAQRQFQVLCGSPGCPRAAAGSLSPPKQSDELPRTPVLLLGALSPLWQLTALPGVTRVVGQKEGRPRLPTAPHSCLRPLVPLRGRPPLPQPPPRPLPRRGAVQ